MKNGVEVVIIGDSTNNTLSAVRSFGEAGVRQMLVLKCDADIQCVSKSRYLDEERVFWITKMDDALSVLEKIAEAQRKPFLICTFDEAAVFVDDHEESLSYHFITPTRGGRIGKLFNKDEQCRLAERCGLTVPRSIVLDRKDGIDGIEIDFPILLKPINSTKGEKSDIHICKNVDEFADSLREESSCQRFIMQEFINKDYELDCIGVHTDAGTIIPGAVRKIRHYPPLIGAGAYGLFMPIDELDVDVVGVDRFLKEAGYYGPFSVEFIHSNGKNYFMEVNFRNEGLAYAATVAGANLHAKYVRPTMKLSKIRPTYMMNYSIDLLYVKNGDLSLWQWIRDFARTRCFINFSWRDPLPAVYRLIVNKLHLGGGKNRNRLTVSITLAHLTEERRWVA